MTPILPPRRQDSPRAPVLQALWTRIRRRVTSGLLFVLPVFITFWVLYWLYSLIRYYAIDPVARLVVYAAQGQRPEADLVPLLEELIAPLVAILVLLAALYALGSYVGMRLMGAFDRMLLRVPVVTAIHNMVRRVFQSFEGPAALTRFKRVVLVPFPHPGMRVPGFVTGACRDTQSNKTILCVFVATTPIPSSGYTLLVPEDEVTELDWSLEETIQAVISGGLSAPQQVRYSARPPGRASKEPTSPTE